MFLQGGDELPTKLSCLANVTMLGCNVTCTCIVHVEIFFTKTDFHNNIATKLRNRDFAQFSPHLLILK